MIPLCTEQVIPASSEATRLIQREILMKEEDGHKKAEA
jgi:hypothetical protein